MRSLDVVIDDALCPAWGLDGPDPESQRDRAIAQVVTQIPQDDYTRLVDLIDTFLWFIPHEDMYGELYPFPWTVAPPPSASETSLQLKQYAKVLYLSPVLETKPLAIVRAVVAHELAHVLLGHDVYVLGPDKSERQEAEAWDRVKAWGFEEDVKEHEADVKK